MKKPIDVNLLLDGKGMSFADYRKHLPTLAADFPPADIVRDMAVLGEYRSRFQHCQWCGVELLRWDVRAELHHIIGGSGRSDEFCNLIMLCNGATGCHSKVYGNLPAVVMAKWKTDTANTDWCRLAVLNGKFLPTPEHTRAPR